MAEEVVPEKCITLFCMLALQKPLCYFLLYSSVDYPVEKNRQLFYR